ncbi:MAG: hypothetical protein P9L96_02790 [Candidatus Gygaella obscura]|nr:hypothetical protein [Candidatus Gygaella obscura]
MSIKEFIKKLKDNLISSMDRLDKKIEKKAKSRCCCTGEKKEADK